MTGRPRLFPLAALLRVEGLDAGDTCYYYVVGAPWTAGAGFQAAVTLE